MTRSSAAPQTPSSRKAAGTASIAWPVSISKAAQLAGISARMARHYESLNLLPITPSTCEITSLPSPPDAVPVERLTVTADPAPT